MTRDTAMALLLLDLQRDFLRPAGRLPVAQEAVEELLTKVNRLAAHFVGQGGLVIYVLNEFSPWDFPANLLRRNAALRGGPGAEFDPRVLVLSERRFTKSAGDAFSNPKLSLLLHEHAVGKILVAGVFAEACVTRTAMGARRLGFEPIVIADAVAGASRSKTEAALRRLSERGIALTTSGELLSATPAR
jgi:nicotinamidase-related amidase